VPDSPVLAVLGELVVDQLPVAGAGAGPDGTAPQDVARPGGKALDVTGALSGVDDAALVAALTCTRVCADPPTRAELETARSAR
jgi:hypothetical protein